MGVEASQWCFAGHGLPGFAAHAAPCRSDRVTTNPLPGPEPIRAAGSSRPHADGHDPDSIGSPRTATGRVTAGETHRRRTVVQQYHGAIPLPVIRTTGGRAPEIPGMGAGPSHCLSGVEFGAAPPGRS